MALEEILKEETEYKGFRYGYIKNGFKAEKLTGWVYKVMKIDGTVIRHSDANFKVERFDDIIQIPRILVIEIEGFNILDTEKKLKQLINCANNGFKGYEKLKKRLKNYKVIISCFLEEK